MSSSEAAPLLPKPATTATATATASATDDGWRLQLHLTLEAKNPFGKKFEAFIICLIAINVTAFMLSTDVEFAAKWQHVLDAIEVGSVAVFTLEYLARFYAIVETNRGQVSYIIKHIMHTTCRVVSRFTAYSQRYAFNNKQSMHIHKRILFDC
jgi:hypothetical protein